jgi:hypothetical protein
MNDIIPSEQIQEGLRGVLELLPLVYVIIVQMAVIALNVVRFDGSTVKYYKAYVLLIAITLAGVAYLFYPEDQVRIRDIPTLIIGCISSLFFTELFIYWRKRKTKK